MTTPSVKSSGQFCDTTLFRLSEASERDLQSILLESLPSVGYCETTTSCFFPTQQAAFSQPLLLVSSALNVTRPRGSHVFYIYIHSPNLLIQHHGFKFNSMLMTPKSRMSTLTSLDSFIQVSLQQVRLNISRYQTEFVNFHYRPVFLVKANDTTILESSSFSFPHTTSIHSRTNSKTKPSSVHFSPIDLFL